MARVPGKKGFFEKLGMIERVDSYRPPARYAESGIEEDDDETGIDTSVEVGAECENFVEEVYKTNNLTDRSRSIFKVEEILHSLPSTMPSETKYGVILDILSTFNLSIEELCADGSLRLKVVEACKEAKTRETNEAVAACQEEIESCKMRIEELERSIADITNRHTVFTSSGEGEIKRITELLDFIAPKSELEPQLQTVRA